MENQENITQKSQNDTQEPLSGERQERVSTKRKKAAMIIAMEKSLGVVSIAVKSAGIERAQHYRWYNDDEKYRAQIDDVENVVIDFVESKLHQRINANDTGAISFYLKTRGKKRGYIENPAFINTTNVTTDIKIGYGQEDKE